MMRTAVGPAVAIVGRSRLSDSDSIAGPDIFPAYSTEQNNNEAAIILIVRQQLGL